MPARNKHVGAALILKKLDVPPEVVLHSENVARIALAVARKVAARGKKVDFPRVRDGALLHDVGRARTHGPKHAVVGFEMLRKAGVSVNVACFAKTHSLGGLTRGEAEGMGLPVEDTLPVSIEERIVCYADKIADSGKMGRIRRHFTISSMPYKRILSLMREVESMIGGKLGIVQDFDAMVVVKKGGKYLAVRRKTPDVWEFPGGGIEWGESPQDAARRECFEECGLKIEVGKILGTTSAVYEKKGKLKHAVYIVFEGKIVGGKLKLSGEHAGARWVGKNELVKLKLGYNARPVVEFLKR